MTREELKKILASKPNKLAEKAIDSIKSGAPVEELKKLVEEGAADKCYRRDPQHPRSKYRVEHVLDSCFHSSFGVVSENSQVSPAGIKSSEFSLGHIPATGGKAEHFSYLLDKGFTPGTNGYRGELFTHIIKSCFYSDPQESAAAMELGKILVDKGKIDIQRFAENHYEWTGSEDKLRKALSLGAKPTPEMLDCALRYCACASNRDEPKNGRADVIRILLDAGVSPSKPLGRLGSAKDQMDFLEKNGLSERIQSSAPLPSGSGARTAGRGTGQVREI